MSFITNEDEATVFRSSKIPPDYQFLPYTGFDWTEDDTIPVSDDWDESTTASGVWAESTAPSPDVWTQSSTASGIWVESTKPTTGFEESD